MKYLFLLSLVAAMLLESCGVTRRMESRPALSVTPSTLDLAVDQSAFPYTVKVNFLVNIPRGYVTTCSQLVITPYFTDGVKVMPLTPLYVNGRTFNRVERRHARLGQPVTNYNGAVSMVAERGDMTVAMSENVVFQPWMTKSELVLATSCVACDKVTTLTKQVLASGMYYMPPSVGPVIIQEAPKPQPPVIIKESWIGQLKYPINSYAIIPELDKNSIQLTELNSLMSRILQNKSLNIVKIMACGIASPDGVATQNKVLAEERAVSLKTYLVDKFKIDPAMVEITSVSEDWAGLREKIAASDLQGKEKFIADLDAAQSDSAREKVMRSSPLYSYIRTHILPSLRRVICEVSYNEVKQVK